MYHFINNVNIMLGIAIINAGIDISSNPIGLILKSVTIPAPIDLYWTPLK